MKKLALAFVLVSLVSMALSACGGRTPTPQPTPTTPSTERYFTSLSGTETEVVLCGGITITLQGDGEIAGTGGGVNGTLIKNAYEAVEVSTVGSDPINFELVATGCHPKRLITDAYSTTLVSQGNTTIEEVISCNDLEFTIRSNGSVSSNEEITLLNSDSRSPHMAIRKGEIFVSITIFNGKNNSIYSIISEGCMLEVK